MIVSPAPFTPSPLSETVALFVTSITFEGAIITSVGSLVVFPSVSSPSSLISETSLVFPGELPVAVTVLFIFEVSAAALDIK